STATSNLRTRSSGSTGGFASSTSALPARPKSMNHSTRQSSGPPPGPGGFMAPEIAARAAVITRWRTESRAACRDRLAGWRSDLSTQRRACLQRGRRALEDLGDAIANAAPGDVFALQTAVVSMAEPSRCTDDALASAQVRSPPAALAPAIESVRDQLEAV